MPLPAVPQFVLKGLGGTVGGLTHDVVHIFSNRVCGLAVWKAAVTVGVSMLQSTSEPKPY